MLFAISFAIEVRRLFFHSGTYFFPRIRSRNSIPPVPCFSAMGPRCSPCSFAGEMCETFRLCLFHTLSPSKKTLICSPPPGKLSLTYLYSNRPLWKVSLYALTRLPPTHPPTTWLPPAFWEISHFVEKWFPKLFLKKMRTFQASDCKSEAFLWSSSGDRIMSTWFLGIMFFCIFWPTQSHRKPSFFWVPKTKTFLSALCTMFILIYLISQMIFYLKRSKILHLVILMPKIGIF